MSEPMINYEVTLIVDPVLSGEEIRTTAQTYVDHLKNEGCTIIHMDEMGLRQLAYPINRRTSGVYFCIEFEAPSGNLINKLELALRRDERIMRFLTVRLDKYGVKYNSDKRSGLIGKVKKKKKPQQDDRGKRRDDNKRSRPAKPQREKKEETVKAAAKTVEKAPAAVEETPKVVKAEAPTAAVEETPKAVKAEDQPTAAVEETPKVAEAVVPEVVETEAPKVVPTETPAAEESKKED